MKQIIEIHWAKVYEEELSTKDADGFYDYAYCYYIYEFQLPDKSLIRARRYTDSLEQCSIFIPTDKENNAELMQLGNCICGISKFLIQMEGIVKITHFTSDKGYQAIDAAKLNCQFTDFLFLERKA